MTRTNLIKILDSIRLVLIEGYVIHDAGFASHVYRQLGDKAVKRVDVDRIVDAIKEASDGSKNAHT